MVRMRQPRGVRLNIWLNMMAMKERPNKKTAAEDRREQAVNDGRL